MLNKVVATEIPRKLELQGSTPTLIPVKTDQEVHSNEWRLSA